MMRGKLSTTLYLTLIIGTLGLSLIPPQLRGSDASPSGGVSDGPDISLFSDVSDGPDEGLKETLGEAPGGGSGGVTVHFIDVGQGDSTFIDAGEYEILVDGGPRSAADDVVNYLRDYVDGPLDLMIATHYHEDHIGGLPQVLETYDVGQVLHNGQKTTSQIYERFTTAIAEEGCPSENARKKNFTVVIDDDTQLRLLAMNGSFSDANNNSLVACLEAGDVKILLTGDVERELEETNLDQFDDIDILKAAHHGSDTSSTQAFLDRTRPELVIISCAEGNSYRHPHLEVLQRFWNIGATVYGTQKSGSIRLTTDGTSYQVSASEPLTAKDAGK